MHALEGPRRPPRRGKAHGARRRLRTAAVPRWSPRGSEGLCAATVPILDPPRESRNQNPVPFTLPENTQRTIAPAMSAQPTLYL